ncbi:MAG: MlaD family protein [Acidobacteriia bacterium]|nr:MlaD family protein [Terriglobia bacterium]
MWRNVRLGAFIVGTLTILAVGVFLIGKKQFLFSSTYNLKSEFDNVAGLKNGAEVRVGGIHKGMVDQIQLPTTSNGKVIVIMELDKSTDDIIKTDSVSSIQTEGLLGDKYVAISFGSQDAPRVKDGDTIGSQPPLDFSGLIKKANQILDTTQDTVSHANDAVANFRSIGSKIDQGKGTVGALINDRKLFDQANAATAQAKAGATAFQENMEALKHNWFLRGFFKQRGYTDTKDLTQNEIARLPQGPAVRSFAYDGKQIFAKPDTAKLKGEKALDGAGRFLEQNEFGLVVVVASTGVQGDAKTNLVLSQARAMVVRDYLVKKFKVDDAHLKTLGQGEIAQAKTGEAGKIEIVVYPVGVGIPPAKYPSSSGG